MTGEATILDLIGAALVVVGILLCLIAAIGLIRLPDVLSRMHAATKPQTLGLLVLLTGLGMSLRDWRLVGLLVVIGALQLLTAPISAHLVARTAYRTRQFRTDLTEPDELDADLSRAGFRLVTRHDEDEGDDVDESAAD
ncbi:monovalent cation/H(+) antiporter subunit G [Microlunatus soli]|uniref:Multisubunit sodium/proton antiporter, MrpG subunit n=1 Tax=Microlunatus soli TaxID=630515 RepID=A0A1H1Y9J1_9ACTN|nr:monovalent cation/H(+) antiporter subunit G [Microlunatus soli]SDT18061.1 multisubunit sodium/proton antiporter, MrpG subunit [Microlunatus soli]